MCFVSTQTSLTSIWTKRGQCPVRHDTEPGRLLGPTWVPNKYVSSNLYLPNYVPTTSKGDPSKKMSVPHLRLRLGLFLI